MLLLLVVPATAIAMIAYGILQAYAPSNILIRHLRASWQTPCMSATTLGVLTSACLVAVHVISVAIDAGAAGWLNLVVLILAWDSIKFGLLALQMLLHATSRSLSAMKRVASSTEQSGSFDLGPTSGGHLA